LINKKIKGTDVQLYNEIVEGAKINDLSKVLPSVLIFSKQIRDKPLEKWAELELNSYFNSNKALTNEVIVPEYRIVAGQYHDVYNRPLIIKNPNLQFVGEYRLRNSVSELEKLSQSENLITIRDTNFTELISETLGVEVHSFSFSPTSIVGILDGIRTNLINRLMKLSQVVEQTAQEGDKRRQHTKLHDTVENLHPLIQPVALKLWIDGHFRQAILDTYILLVNTVKTKSGRHDLDGSGLMQTVFSPKTPIIKISDDPDEQLGFMWMFSGAVMGIRNPKAHKLIQQKDPQRTLEWLSFASVLLRVLDDAEVIKTK